VQLRLRLYDSSLNPVRSMNLDTSAIVLELKTPANDFVPVGFVTEVNPGSFIISTITDPNFTAQLANFGINVNVDIQHVALSQKPETDVGPSNK